MIANRKRLLSKVAGLDVSKVDDTILDRHLNVRTDARSSERQV